MKKTYLFMMVLAWVFMPFKKSCPLYGQIAIAENGIQCICSQGGYGGIAIIASGTAGPFTFRWEGPEGYTSDVQNPTNLTLPGEYTVSVTNAYGCTVVFP